MGLGRRVTLYNSIICLGILAYSMLAILFLCERHLPRKELPIQNRLPIQCARDGWNSLNVHSKGPVLLTSVLDCRVLKTELCAPSAMYKVSNWFRQSDRNRRCSSDVPKVIRSLAQIHANAAVRAGTASSST